MSVKLVAEAGIGTVASGVAKGNADVIQVDYPLSYLCFEQSNYLKCLVSFLHSLSYYQNIIISIICVPVKI